MASPKVTEPMKKITVRLFEDDLTKLRIYYPTVGYNAILRALTRKHIRLLDHKTTERMSHEELADE